MRYRNTKNSLLTLLIFSVILLLPLNASAEVLFGEAYQQTLHNHLTRAEKSIIIAMYFIILEPKGKGPINELVNDLIDAENRAEPISDDYEFEIVSGEYYLASSRYWDDVIFQKAKVPPGKKVQAELQQIEDALPYLPKTVDFLEKYYNSINLPFKLEITANQIRDN